jgi:adenylate kinase family enzyme
MKFPPGKPFHVHITGASGSGATTLGSAFAQAHVLKHLDTDDYFWAPTDPPYQQIRPREERMARLGPDLAVHPRWVLSGSLVGWGDPLRPLFDLVIFLYIPAELRLERLKKREIARYGAASLHPGGRMHDHHVEFMAWAARYDDGDESVRSLLLHNRWLADLECPVIRLEGDMTVGERLERIEEHASLQSPGGML